MKIVGVTVEIASQANIVALTEGDAQEFARRNARTINRDNDATPQISFVADPPETDEALYVTPAARALLAPYTNGDATMTPAEFDTALAAYRVALAVIDRNTDRRTVPMRLPYEDGRVETVGGVYTVPMRLPYEDGRVEIVEGVAL